MKVFIVTLALVAAVCGMPSEMLRPTFDHSAIIRPLPDYTANMHDIIRPTPEGVASIPADSPLVQIIVNVKSDKAFDNAVETIHIPPVGTFPLDPIEIPDHIQTLPIMPIDPPSAGTFPMFPVEDLTRPIIVETGDLLRPNIETPSAGTFPIFPVEDLTRPVIVDTGSLLRPTVDEDASSLLRPIIPQPIAVAPWPMPISERPATSLIRKH